MHIRFSFKYQLKFQHQLYALVNHRIMGYLIWFSLILRPDIKEIWWTLRTLNLMSKTVLHLASSWTLLRKSPPWHQVTVDDLAQYTTILHATGLCTLRVIKRYLPIYIIGKYLSRVWSEYFFKFLFHSTQSLFFWHQNFLSDTL